MRDGTTQMHHPDAPSWSTDGMFPLPYAPLQWVQEGDAKPRRWCHLMTEWRQDTGVTYLVYKRHCKLDEGRNCAPTFDQYTHSARPWINTSLCWTSLDFSLHLQRLPEGCSLILSRRICGHNTSTNMNWSGLVPRSGHDHSQMTRVRQVYLHRNRMVFDGDRFDLLKSRRIHGYFVEKYDYIQD